ncbi:putative oxidoreductase [Streptomyces sp. SAI-135]|uniref:DoxX family protein n=1 Tax=unclassified Streptomyces TaxID=2593676 RepID=UPI002472F4A2|nr:MULTISPECIES: DoxX family protein [unclassified Streptomyces]MDH6522858.1 putative oxidoreductase [Streptomyces sp. SAI-090]MDH6554478.1 putative oxidoreductase [Streptomyces sp. SAI-041]MDH6581524.1 putative oxidoreductase [Streptomyces sp. SAI-133]MDH6613527.1 putative oxidoreductase [Streptomyces sp. SAI-135]
MSSTDLALLALRGVIGGVFLAHGLNHILGGGRLRGTAGWFASLGMRPGYVHAVVASAVEVASGALLVFGLFTPVAGAGVVGTMVVAWVINHAKNGFFIFRPGEGYEYVMVLAATGLCLAGTGPGRISLDRLIGIGQPGWTGLVIGLAGVVGAGLLLALCWRPEDAG